MTGSAGKNFLFGRGKLRRNLGVSLEYGRVAELVDATDLKSVGRKVLRVRVPPCPQTKNEQKEISDNYFRCNSASNNNYSRDWNHLHDGHNLKLRERKYSIRTGSCSVN